VDKKVALKDIAQKVGVSVALVSYVLNGKEKIARISQEMAEKIRAVAAELNYQPNLIAKSLKSGRTNTIGLIVADISNPFFSSIARIVEDEARKYGYVVIFGSSDENADKQQSVIDVFENRLVDAFIIAAASGTEKQITALKNRGVPVILIDRYFSGDFTDSVRLDDTLAAEQAVNQLVLNNRKKIALVTYNTKALHMQHREEGYKNALKKNNIPFKNSLLIKINYQNIEAEVAEKIAKLIDPLQVDAFLCATNSLGVAVLRTVYRRNIQVPGEIALISFDKSDVFDFFYSPVTYVSQSIEEMGKAAVTLAVQKLKDPTPERNSTIIIQPMLVIRKSCGGKTSD